MELVIKFGGILLILGLAAMFAAGSVEAISAVFRELMREGKARLALVFGCGAAFFMAGLMVCAVGVMVSLLTHDFVVPRPRVFNFTPMQKPEGAQ